jgi:flagellar basal-body rod protein FlgC
MFGNFSAMDISASGLTAERTRMEVTANNIANANTTKTATGDPYRRQAVVFSSMLEESSGHVTTGANMSGVQVLGIEADQTDFPLVYNPGHPHADENGMLRLSNVSIPNEMVDLITASRSYEANLRSMSLFKEMVEQTLTLLQGGR